MLTLCGSFIVSWVTLIIVAVTRQLACTARLRCPRRWVFKLTDTVDFGTGSSMSGDETSTGSGGSSQLAATTMCLQVNPLHLVSRDAKGGDDGKSTSKDHSAVEITSRSSVPMQSPRRPEELTIGRRTTARTASKRKGHAQ